MFSSHPAAEDMDVKKRSCRKVSVPVSSGDPAIASSLSQFRLRLRVLRHRSRLDRELADGRAADVSVDRALRAQQLVDSRTRRGFARSLRRLVAAAERPPALIGSAVPVRRDAIQPWREGLLGLADRLERSGPINPCGVARVVALVTDGAGPFYNAGSERSIADAVWWAADGMQPCPPHAWGSPVIMKLDPEHAAWTCARCGAIALTADPAVRPA